MAAEQHVEERQAAPERGDRSGPSWWSHPDGTGAQREAIFRSLAASSTPQQGVPPDGGHGPYSSDGAGVPGQRSRIGRLRHRRDPQYHCRPTPTPRERPPLRLRSPRGLTIVTVVVVFASLVGGGLGVAIESAVQGGRLTLHQAPAPTAGKQSSHAATVLRATLPGVVYLQVSISGASSTGTGVLLDANGNILTNSHVVAPQGQDGKVTVTFSTGQHHPAAIVGRDVGSDLAVVRVTGVSGLDPAVLGDSDDVQIGDPVMAVGAPFGLRGTVTSGIVSALDRPIASGGLDAPPGRSYLDAIQTDAPINPGNSGGPLLDASGTVIGINTVIRTSDPDSSDPFGSSSASGSIGLGFAIPIDQATSVAGQLINTGKAAPPSIGVTLDREFQGGAKVTSVQRAHSPLRSGDIVTAVDTVAVTDADDLIGLVRGRKQGGETVLTVLRGGQSLPIVVKLVAAPSDTTFTRA
ncbi:putative serine protease PepD [Streptacidiphilus sp. MAP12-20]|uniref:S1C family serine protease n=1 Tax=Streptacidiphilus sp. MAP12-20 TaxID=3156299 RepID=UPI0035122A91